MENFLIPRRFVRIKALQNLYAYTIREQAHRQEAIESVKKDFRFDQFLHDPDQKEPLAKAQNIAVTLFCQAIATQLPIEDFYYEEDSKIQESVRKHLCHYLAAIRQDQLFFQNGFSQSQEAIQIGLQYTLLLLIAWHKLAKAESASCRELNHLFKKKLSQDPLLEELYNNNKWINTIYKDGMNWTKDEDQVANWYSTFVQSVEASKGYASAPDNNVNFLESILEDIIFKEGPINDFLAMQDLYWDEHKRVIKKFLNQTFIMLSRKDFDTFTLFWQSLDRKWAIEEAFYNRLFTAVIQNKYRYEAMIGEKAEKWDSDRILLTDKLILKLALAELFECDEIPFKVSINEYIEMAKWYGTSKSGLFINGILEGILKGLDKEKGVYLAH